MAEKKKNMTGIRDEYRDYTMGLAVFDLLPVVLFLMSGLIMYSMYDSPLLLAGVLSCFTGGMCKAVWKIIVVKKGRDLTMLTRLFRILMSAGSVLMLASVIAGGSEAFSGLLKSVTMMPAAVFFAAAFALFCMMGYLGSHMDSSAGANWIEEAVNTLAQIALLVGVIAVYFGTYYHADETALAALAGSDDVTVTEIGQECGDAEGWFFDGPGTDAAMIFYPGAKVEASAYAPLMKDVAAGGIDCYLCRMPLNFALLGKDDAASIRTACEGGGSGYERWYIGGHSLGGATAAMAADDAEDAAEGAQWDGLILLAAYPTDELVTPVLTIYGTEDKVLNREKYEKADEDGLWPDDLSELEIEGGNHAQFGCYGDQEGDGKAFISQKDQQDQTAAAMIEWIGRSGR